jgi:hypothetical protein
MLGVPADFFSLAIGSNIALIPKVPWLFHRVVMCIVHLDTAYGEPAGKLTSHSVGARIAYGIADMQDWRRIRLYADASDKVNLDLVVIRH